MPSATFFLMPEASEDEQTALICDKIAELYRKHKRLRVWAQNQAQAEALDELLWQRPADAFIPHNLVGEGAATGSPVEIGWPQIEPGSTRPGYALFNLANEVPVQAQQSQQLYDIVPASDEGKAVARERYKHYRARGCQMHTVPLISEQK
jgi:DNA polymerase-3 subunit chi